MAPSSSSGGLRPVSCRSGEGPGGLPPTGSGSAWRGPAGAGLPVDDGRPYDQGLWERSRRSSEARSLEPDGVVGRETAMVLRRAEWGPDVPRLSAADGGAVSYILDALRKAERDRQVSRVPTLATAHGGADLLRRPHWAWAVAAGAVALSALVIYSPPWAPPRPDPAREAPPSPAAPPTRRRRGRASIPSAAASGARAWPRRSRLPRPRRGSRPAGRRASARALPSPARPRVSPSAKAARAARAGDVSGRLGPRRTYRPAPGRAGPPWPTRRRRPPSVDRAPVAPAAPARELSPSPRRRWRRRLRRWRRCPRRWPRASRRRGGQGRPARPRHAVAAARARRARLLGDSRGAARLHQRTEVHRGADGGRRRRSSSRSRRMGSVLRAPGPADRAPAEAQSRTPAPGSP